MSPQPTVASSLLFLFCTCGVLPAALAQLPPDIYDGVYSSDVLSLKLPGLSISYFASDTLRGYGHSPAAIHDGNPNCPPDPAAWHSEATSPSGAHYVGVQFTNYVVRVESYRATGRQGCSPQYAPGPYQLQGSNSSDPTSFRDMEAPSAIRGRGPMTTWVTVRSDTTQAFSYLRLYFPYPDYVALGEMTIAGTLIYSPAPVPCGSLDPALCGYLQAQSDVLRQSLAATSSLANGAGMTVGMVGYFPFACPSGWLRCNGAAVSRTAFGPLFRAVGTQHGSGDGSTTFNVPDLRGEFIRAVDDGRGVDPGRAVNSFQQATGVYNNYGGATMPDLSNGLMNADGTVTNPSVLGLQVGFKYNTGPRPYGYVRPRNVALHACIKV